MSRPVSKGKAYAFLPIFERGPRGDTTDRVEKVLRAAVVGLEFAPGEFIDKVSVCERLGVSRFPVSEALARLASEGLVEILPQRGTRAALIRLPEVTEAMLIRRALEAAVAETAARRLEQEAIRALHHNLAEQESAVLSGDRLRFHQLDLAFHELLVVGLRLARVGAVIESSRASVDRVRQLLSSPRRHAVTLAEHRGLVAAIEMRDPDAARRAMEAHLDAVMEEMERFSIKHPEVFARE
jgi:GntR family transcriptional regulator, rspAB operon transcriptional repressor